MAKELLKDVVVRNAKPTDKDFRLSDGEGLYLLIKTNGAKWWRFDYTFSSSRKTLSLGVYPVTSLSDARRKAEDARIKISNDINPSDVRKKEKAVKAIAIENEIRRDGGMVIINSFADITAHWLTSIEHLTRPQTHNKKSSRLTRLAFPVLGDMLINSLKRTIVPTFRTPVIRN